MHILCRIGIHSWLVKFQHKQRAYDGVWFDIDQQRCRRKGCRWREWRTHVEVSPYQMPY